MITNVRGSGFPPKRLTAKMGDRRFVGLYYYSHYWKTWDKIVAVSKTEWVVHQVDLEGNQIEDSRSHCTPLWVCHFANKPFTNITY